MGFETPPSPERPSRSFENCMDISDINATLSDMLQNNETLIGGDGTVYTAQELMQQVDDVRSSVHRWADQQNYTQGGVREDAAPSFDTILNQVTRSGGFREALRNALQAEIREQGKF